MQTSQTEKKSLGLPTPAELKKLQKAHIQSQIEPELVKLHDKFKLWTTTHFAPDTDVPATFYTDLGLNRLNYMLSLRNKEIIIEYKDVFPDTITAFVQDINQTEFWLASATTHAYKDWIDQFRMLKELPQPPSVTPAVTVIRITVDGKKKPPSAVLGMWADNFQKLIEEDVAKMANHLKQAMTVLPTVTKMSSSALITNFKIDSATLQAFGVFPDSINTFIRRIKDEDFWTASTNDIKGPLPPAYTLTTLTGIEILVKPLGSG